MADHVIPLKLECTGTQISPLLFGHFIEFIENCIDGGVRDPGSRFSDADGIRRDVLEMAKGLGPALLRWPGGTFANIYHWMDAVGPAGERKKRRNLIWGGVVDNRFGTAEFVRYCRALGAEPMLCVNMANGSAQEAADWVEYCNGEPGTYFADLRVMHGYPEPFHVRYWCIGNESYAEPDLGAQHVPERYISDAWEFTKHMKLMDPTLKMVYVGNPSDMDWNRRILESLAPVCDYLSVHYYAGEDARGMYAPFASLAGFREDLENVMSVVRTASEASKPLSQWYRFPGREGEIRLAVDEWNIWNSAYQGEDNRYGLKMIYTWRDALWTACMMNTLALHARDIGMANLAQMVNVLSPIVAGENGCFPQTTYPVLKLYREQLSGELVRCCMDAPEETFGAAGSLPMLDASACRRADGSLCLFLVNISQTDRAEVVLPDDVRSVRSVELRAPDFGAVSRMGQDAVAWTEEECPAGPVYVRPGSVRAVILEAGGQAEL